MTDCYCLALLESINKLGHASSVSKNYCWKSSFPVADTLCGLHGKCGFKSPHNSSCVACWDFACLYQTVGEKSSDKVSEGFAVLCKKLLVIFLSCCLSWPNIFQCVLRRKRFEVISHDYSREIWCLSLLPLKLVQRLKTPRSTTSLVLSISLRFLCVCVYSVWVSRIKFTEVGVRRYSGDLPVLGAFVLFLYEWILGTLGIWDRKWLYELTTNRYSLA